MELAELAETLLLRASRLGQHISLRSQLLSGAARRLQAMKDENVLSIIIFFPGESLC